MGVVMFISVIRLKLGDGVIFTFDMCVDEVTGPSGLATEPVLAV
jgi:hypothetical protein